MKHVSTLTSATLKQTAAHGGCGECPDFLPVCLQDLLRRG